MADDSFLVEAPSLVVPYLIGKSGPKDLKECLETIDAPPKAKDDMVNVGEEDSKDSMALSEEDSNDSVILSEEDSDDSFKKEPESISAAVDKSQIKSEMDESSVKAESSKEDEYFSGPIGRFFLDMGLTLVQEYVHGDLLRAQKNKADKGLDIADPSLSVDVLSKGEWNSELSWLAHMCRFQVLFYHLYIRIGRH